MQSNGRDDNGRFTAGNGYGKGRPPRDAELTYLSKLTQECSEDRWGNIVRRAVTDAEEGNPKAREWLSSYLIGRPMHRVDITYEEPDTRSEAEQDREWDAMLLKLGYVKVPYDFEGSLQDLLRMPPEEREKAFREAQHRKWDMEAQERKEEYERICQMPEGPERTEAFEQF